MPYLPFSDLDEQRKKADQNGQVNISGGSTTINQAAQNIAAPKPVQRSGSWTNLNAYIDANKDNAESLGITISGNISNAGNQVRTGIQNSQDDFNSLADKGTISNLGTAKQDSDSIVRQARTSAQYNQIGDDQANRFKEVSNAAYKGPQSLDASQYYSDTQSKLNKAKEYQTSAQSDEGRFNLLKEMYNRPTYSQGQKNLDNLLLVGNQQAKTSIQNAATGLNDLQGSWDQAIGNAASTAKQRAADSDAVRQYAQDQLSSNRNERILEVDSDLADKQAHWADQYNHYNDLLSNYKGGELGLTREEANTLALKDSGQGLYNLLNGGPASYYLDLKNYDANKVVSKDQYAQLSALDRLANQFGSGSISKFSDPSQAETLGLNNNFSASKFGEAASNADTAFNKYADNTNVEGHGANTQSYYTGLLGTDRHEVQATTDLVANLANFLNNGNLTVDGRAVSSPTGGIHWNSNSQSSGDAIADLARNGVNQIGEAIFNWDWSGQNKGGAAANAAKNVASTQAQANFMNQLNDLLNQQGYANRVKIKD